MKNAVIIFLVSILSFSSLSSEGGAGDGGGGLTLPTSIARTKYIIKSVWENAHIPGKKYKINKNILFAFIPLITKERQFETNIDNTSTSLLSKLVVSNHTEGLAASTWFWHHAIPKSIEDIFLSSKLTIKENSSCLHDGEEKDASYYSENGENIICFSAKRLSRLPEYSLRLTVMGLLFHELGHLHGYSEQEAVKLQRFFENKMNFILNGFYESLDLYKLMSRQIGIVLAALHQIKNTYYGIPYRMSRFIKDFKVRSRNYLFIEGYFSHRSANSAYPDYAYLSSHIVSDFNSKITFGQENGLRIYNSYFEIMNAFANLVPNEIVPPNHGKYIYPSDYFVFMEPLVDPIIEWNTHIEESCLKIRASYKAYLDSFNEFYQTHNIQIGMIQDHIEYMNLTCK